MFSVLYLCIVAIKFAWGELVVFSWYRMLDDECFFDCLDPRFNRNEVGGSPSAQKKKLQVLKHYHQGDTTTSTYLANTQLEELIHYYTGYTLLELLIWHVLNISEFEQKDEISISKDESKYEVPQHENARLTPRKKCMDH
jgi:hypothetical protein